MRLRYLNPLSWLIQSSFIIHHSEKIHHLSADYPKSSSTWQSEPQTITIVFHNHSFNRHVEFNQARKMISQIAGQGKEVFQDVINLARATQSSALTEPDVTKPAEDVEVVAVNEEADLILQKMLGQCRLRI